MKYLNQNMKLIIIAISVFIVSLATGLLIYNHSAQDYHKANVIVEDDMVEFKLNRIEDAFK